MNRAARLFMLMDALRGRRRPVAAAQLAAELDVSLRTIYRDVQTLVALGAPIEGEAGVGYVLRSGFFLPPLMFNTDELEALVLGARWVQRQGDDALGRAAAAALAKIATASPQDLRDTLAETGLWAPPSAELLPSKVELQQIRDAVRNERKLQIDYTDEHGSVTQRVIWPIALAFYDGRRCLAAWCELRDGFRVFRTDRIDALIISEQRYPQRRSVLYKAWQHERNLAYIQPN